MSDTQLYGSPSDSALDNGAWQVLELELPGFGTARFEERAAELSADHGYIRLHVESFERSDGRLQLLDNPKHLMVSTASFDVPENASVSFSVEMAAANINGNPDDYRDGFAAFNVMDLETAWVWDHAITSTRAWAVHERLQIPGVVSVEDSLYRVVEDVYHMPAIVGSEFHEFRIELDSREACSRWYVDGRQTYQAASPALPAKVRIGFGLVTLRQIRNGRSESAHGQGMTATFRNFRVPAHQTR